jgi:hypothetical protein
VLTALDRIKAIVGGLAASGSEPSGDDSGLVEALNAAAAGQAPPKPAAPAVQAAPEPEEEPPAPAEEVALPVPAPTPAQAAPGAPQGEPVATNQTIRVTVDVLEDLMTLVSELVLTRNQLLQLARTQENNGFTVPLQRLSHITSDLQEGVMKTRMQPSFADILLNSLRISRIFPSLPPNLPQGGARIGRGWAWRSNANPIAAPGSPVSGRRRATLPGLCRTRQPARVSGPDLTAAV